MFIHFLCAPHKNHIGCEDDQDRRLITQMWNYDPPTWWCKVYSLKLLISADKHKWYRVQKTRPTRIPLKSKCEKVPIQTYHTNTNNFTLAPFICLSLSSAPRRQTVIIKVITSIPAVKILTLKIAKRWIESKNANSNIAKIYLHPALLVSYLDLPGDKARLRVKFPYATLWMAYLFDIV